MNISSLPEVKDALLLVQSGLDAATVNTLVLPATLELLNLVTDFVYSLDQSAPQYRRVPTTEWAEDEQLYIAAPAMAISALLLVESGLQTAQQLPSVLPATRAVLARVIDYFGSLPDTSAPAAPPA